MKSNNTEINLSIIPVSSEKTPYASWKKYQKEIAPIEYWHNHYLNQGSVGIITGAINNNLECIDIDVKNDLSKTIMDEYKSIIPLNLYNRLIVQTTPNNGFHLIYQCPNIVLGGNQKLALEANGEVIIETRSEGGYFCTNIIKNKILQGVLDLKNTTVDIPIITPEERDLLLELARSLTRYFDSNKTIKSKAFEYSDPIINDFNRNFNIIDVFKKHDWIVTKDDNEKVYLLRKGSLAVHSGYYFKDKQTFFCFSTSTEFRPEKPYNHFQIMQILEGKNDYKSTLNVLSEYGYIVATKSKSDKISADDIAKFLNEKGVRYDTLIQDLTLDGMSIEEMDYNTLYIDMKKHFNKEIARTRYEEVIKSNYIQTINPLEDFINKNINRTPSGTFEKWIECLELKNKNIDKSIAVKYLKKWYVGMIAQALNYEYPNEFFLTLLSTEQGVGKTSFLRNSTLPKELQPYRKEHSLSFDDDFKVIMSQCILIIDDEMDGRTYEADKTFKTVLSTKELTMRRKYDRRISTIKRRCSFAGSGNNLYIVREQQNRRIIPIEIEKIYFNKLAQIDLIDLFMEAYHLLISGFEYSYKKENINDLYHLYSDYVQQSDIDLIIDDFINKPIDDNEYLISSLDLVNTLLMQYPNFTRRINVVAIGKLMTDKGYERIKKGRNKTLFYKIGKHSKIVPFLTSDSQSHLAN